MVVATLLVGVMFQFEPNRTVVANLFVLVDFIMVVYESVIEPRISSSGPLI